MTALKGHSHLQRPLHFSCTHRPGAHWISKVTGAGDHRNEGTYRWALRTRASADVRLFSWFLKYKCSWLTAGRGTEALPVVNSYSQGPGMIIGKKGQKSYGENDFSFTRTRLIAFGCFLCYVKSVPWHSQSSPSIPNHKQWQRPGHKWGSNVTGTHCYPSLLSLTWPSPGASTGFMHLERPGQRKGQGRQLASSRQLPKMTLAFCIS